MSNEEERVSKAFLQSVLSAESSDADEPEEMPDPEADRILATKLADKYAVHPKAAPWFRRPAWVAGISAAVAAAAAIAILRRPVDPIEAPVQTVPPLSVTVVANAGTLSTPEKVTAIRLSEYASWTLSLRAQTQLDGDVDTLVFVRRGKLVGRLDLDPKRAGNRIDLQMSAASIRNGSGTADLFLVTCRSSQIPKAEQLNQALQGLEANRNELSVPLPNVDCQVNSIAVELSEVLPR